MLFISHAGCVQDQARGEGVDICTDEIVDGVSNPFFANRPMYSANERPLMDVISVDGAGRVLNYIYKWETSAIDRNGATNTSNYVRVGRISPAVTSGDMPFVESDHMWFLLGSC